MAGNTTEARTGLGLLRAEMSPVVVRRTHPHADSVARPSVPKLTRIADAIAHASRLLHDETGQAIGLWAKANADRWVDRLKRSVRG